MRGASLVVQVKVLRRCVPWIFLLALLAPAALRTEEGDAQRPMTVEDVVRLHAAGVPQDELIRQIRARPPSYDLSEEMVTELRRVGLAPEVIREMRWRQEHVVPTDAADGPRQTGDARLVVAFNPDRTKSRQRRLRVEDRVDPFLAMEWKLGNAPEDRRFVDLALFVACRRAEHVPDHWRSRTPLRWDAAVMPRHEMLAFAPGARWTRSSFLAAFGFSASNLEEGTTSVQERTGHGVLELEIPLALEARVESGVAHDLTVGLALAVGESYYPWSISALDDVLVGPEGLKLEARVSGAGSGRLDGIDVTFVAAEARNARALVVRGCCTKP